MNPTQQRVGAQRAAVRNNALVRLFKTGYVAELVSAKTLGSGAFTKSFYDGKDEVFGTNYKNTGSHFGELGAMVLIAQRVEFLDALGAPFTPTVTTLNDRAIALEKLKRQASIVVEKQGKKKTAMGLVTMSGAAPTVYQPLLENSSSPANIVRPIAIADNQVSRELANKIAAYPFQFPNKGIFFESPNVGAGVKLESHNNGAVPTILETAIMQITTLVVIGDPEVAAQISAQ